MPELHYTITRACLQEGSLRLLRYVRPHFDLGQPIKLFDDAGHEYELSLDAPPHEATRLLGMTAFYRNHNLGVNDEVVIAPLVPGCYKATGVVKHYARPKPPERNENNPSSLFAMPVPKPKPAPVPAPEEAPRETIPPQQATSSITEIRTTTDAEGRKRVFATPASEAPLGAPERLANMAAASAPAQAEAGASSAQVATSRLRQALSAAPRREVPTLFASTPLAADQQAPAMHMSPLEALETLAARCGYHLQNPVKGWVRLFADMGPFSYVVWIQYDPVAGTSIPREESAYRLRLGREGDPADHLFTREALNSLLDDMPAHPHSPQELRPLWEAGRFNTRSLQALEHSRGGTRREHVIFMGVLRALAQQPPFSAFTVSELSHQLPEADQPTLRRVLATLISPPFSLISQPGPDHYLLERSAPALLRNLGGELSALAPQKSRLLPRDEGDLPAADAPSRD